MLTENFNVTHRAINMLKLKHYTLKKNHSILLDFF